MPNLTLEQSVIKTFRSKFHADPQIVLKAPGRINLIGEHTDYNQGFVLPAAIDRYMVFAMTPNESNSFRIKAIDENEEIALDYMSLQKSENSWANFFIGNLIELFNVDLRIPGFDCVFSSNIPRGAGMSSSSALECGFLTGIQTMFDLPLNKMDLVHISQRCNHNFLGLQGGIMDQFATLHGKKDCAIRLDCQDYSYSYYNAQIPHNTWVIINSSVQHELIDSAYNDRVRACKRVVKTLQDRYPEIGSLRDVSMSVLMEYRSSISKNEWKKARYILDENERVLRFADALKVGDVELMGHLLYQSHEGLRHDYEVSCAEMDLLVDLTLDIPEIAGARMMGGGFGGCTINLVHESALALIIPKLVETYNHRTGLSASYYHVELSGGIRMIQS